VGIIISVARELNGNSTSRLPYPFSEYFKSESAFLFARHDLLRNIHSALISCLTMNKESILTFLQTRLGTTPTIFNTERVAMGTRDLSIRLDVLLSACALGSFAWMCSLRFRR
jgi:hypothetical protein